MKLTRYTKFTGDLSTSFDLEDLMEALSDFFLDSGFNDPWSQFENASDSMEDLREAGFINVDCWYKHSSFAVMSGTRP